ncbi:MAG: ion transporter [Candidatus Poribacteria bacterium]
MHNLISKLPMSYSSIKKRIFDVLQGNHEGGIVGRIIEIFIILIIFLNIIAVIIETVESIYNKNPDLFYDFEIFSIIVFTVEYVLRLWGCTSRETYKNPIKGRIKFALTPLVIIDLISILPFYLPMLITLDLRFLRALRLLRIFRILKVGRYFESIRLIGKVFMMKKEELAITVFMVAILLIIASCLMYYVENQSQPKAFASIPMAMWWGVATLTTVGYGDVYPVTPFGKFLGAIIALLGIGIFALPTGILGSGFIEEIAHKKSEKHKVCPHCGKEIDSE